MFLAATFTFVLIKSIPGGPFGSDKMIHPQIMENLNEKYGLDEPLHRQYFLYMKNLLRGDLGISMIYKNRSVGSIIKRAFPVSLSLGIRAVGLAVLVSLLLGILPVLHKNKVLDCLVLIVTVLAVSMPGFVIGTLLQYLVSFRLSEALKNIVGIRFNIFPVTGWGGFRYTVVPSLALAAGVTGMMAKMLRAGMKDVLNQNYIIMCRAKGMTNKEVVLRHALKNAILPLLSISGPLIASIITGSFVIENIFSIPGLGQYFVSGVQDKDYTMVVGLSVFTVFVAVLANTVTDIIYAVADPRVRITSKK
jgi:oligopeptide transport system permease protein